MATTKSPAKTTTGNDGWKRDPAKVGPLMWLPLPDGAAKLVENDTAWKAGFICRRGTGRGVTAIAAVTDNERDKLLAKFKELLNTDNKQWAKAAVRRIEVEAPRWNVGITGLRGDGWPLRAKAESAANVDASKTPKKGTATRKTTATPRAPRTQSPHSAPVKAVETRNAQTPRKEPSRTSPDSVGAPVAEKQ